MKSGHDANGNPMRAFVVMSGSLIVAVFDEGYLGDAAWRKEWPAAESGPEFEVTRREYRDLMRLGKELSKAFKVGDRVRVRALGNEYSAEARAALVNHVGVVTESVGPQMRTVCVLMDQTPRLDGTRLWAFSRAELEKE